MEKAILHLQELSKSLTGNEFKVLFYITVLSIIQNKKVVIIPTVEFRKATNISASSLQTSISNLKTKGFLNKIGTKTYSVPFLEIKKKNLI